MSPRKILGDHPIPEVFGCYTIAEDGSTNSGFPHRSLEQDGDCRPETIVQLRDAPIRHHVSAAMVAQDRRKIKNLRTLGYPIEDANIRRFPRSDTTRKGNFVFMETGSGHAI